MLIDWKKFPEVPTARAGATRRAMSGGKISAVRINLPADAPFNLRHHSHDNEQLLVIVKGELHFRVDDNRFTARDGDTVLLAPRTATEPETESNPLYDVRLTGERAAKASKIFSQTPALAQRL